MELPVSNYLVVNSQLANHNHCYFIDPGSGHLESQLGHTSIHHNKCEYLLPAAKQHERCTECCTLRKTLTTQVHRLEKGKASSE